MSEMDAKYYYNKGIIYNEEGKYGLAIDNFKNALALNPESIEINFNLGVAYINKKEYVPAIECFKFVLEKTPDEVAALSNIALAYAKNSDFNSAINYYQKVLLITPDDSPTFKDLGDAYTKNKQYDKAIEYYEKFLKIHPTSFVVKESLSTAINLKKNADGTIEKKEEPKVIQHQKTIVDNNKSADNHFNLAVNFVKEQDFDAAIENLRSCLKINPDYSGAYTLLNKLFKVKEKLSSISAGKQNIKVNTPVDPIFIDYRKFNEYYTLGMAYYNAQNCRMALENFQKGLEINPSDQNCKNYINEIKSKMN